MRSGKQLLLDSKQFSCENRLRSWLEVLTTLALTAIVFAIAFLEIIPLPVKFFSSIFCGLLYVRLFVIYHDYEHRAILQNSEVAHWLMIFLGIYLLAPETIWKRSHEHHHNNNSKLTLSGIGSYPTVSKEYFLSLPKSKQRLYLINRHPVTGLLIAAFGGSVGFGLAAASSYVALALYARVRIQPVAPASSDRHAFGQFVDGLAFVGGNFVFAGLVGLSLINSVFGMSYLTMLPIYADQYFGTGSTGYGMLSAAHGVGSLIGTLTLASLAHRIQRPGTALLIMGGCVGLELMAFSRAPAMSVALPLLVSVGFSNTFYLTQVNTILQTKTPDQLRGRVMSLYSLCWNLLPLGGLLAGALAAAVDARFAVMVGGAVVAANAGVLLTSRRLRAIGRDDALTRSGP